MDIAILGSSVHERRQTEVLKTVKTLDELTEEIKKRGFIISRSGLYLRLLPRRADSIEGKKHVTTVPVKLAKAQTDMHKSHIDSKFAATSICHLEQVASILGPGQVMFFSQDDKARVPIGITAANKQAPLLMHLEYRVSLPDHDWVVAPSHKLVPSVYAGIKINTDGFGNNKVVSYSGPTYVAIRSGKHSSSTALSHAKDFEEVLNLEHFDIITKTNTGNLKPVCIVTVDGGPDENPRYTKVVEAAVHHFIKNDFDAYFVACNAPGRSAFNRVERRMAPLSKELAGVILPFEYYGSHLDQNCKTVDLELEKKNFGFAGKALAEIWSNMVIDNFQVIAEYISAEDSEPTMDIIKKSQSWLSIHVRSSQYFLQIVKCDDRSCCPAFRSQFKELFPNRFLPPPVSVGYNEDALTIKEQGHFMDLFGTLSLKDRLNAPLFFKNFKEVPYDIMCPSVKEALQKRICKKCGLYGASLKYILSHQKDCGREANIKRIRPERVAAKRQKEFLVQLDKTDQELQWIDEDVLENVAVAEYIYENASIEVISMENAISTPWKSSDD